MYIQEISIEIKNTIVNRDELVDEFESFMGFYRRSGQILRKSVNYISNDKIVCLPYTMEKNSLDKKFNNSHINIQSEKIEKLCNSKLVFKTVGKSYDSYKPCECKKPTFYILITNFLAIESPLTCGTCDKSVPLYRLPESCDFGYRSILAWEENYISCDSLQMNCQVGERWASNQMQQLNSQLSKQGLEVCRKIEELTSIPTYYYLHNYKIFKGDQLTKPCPGCGEKWDLKTPLHNLYRFKCDKCKLVSIIF